MAIETVCAGCRLPLRVGEEHRGRQARCPACGHIFSISPASGAGTGATSSSPEIALGELRMRPSVYGGVPGGGQAAEAATPIPSNGPTQWYMKTPEGQTYGPVDRAELDKWLGEGRIAADCDLRESASGWMPADRVYPLLAPRLISASPGRRANVGQLTGHRAGLILGLAIGGLALAIFLACPVLSVMAWVMGSGDLREMQAGRMDSSGQDTTCAGQIIGMIVSLLWIVTSVILLFCFLLAAVSNS